MARRFAARFSLQSSSPASNWDGDWRKLDIPRPSTLDEAKLYGCCYSSMLLSNSAIRHPSLELLQCSQVDSQTIFWSLRADRTATFLLKNPQMISYYVAFYFYFKFWNEDKWCVCWKYIPGIQNVPEQKLLQIHHLDIWTFQVNPGQQYLRALRIWRRSQDWCSWKRGKTEIGVSHRKGHGVAWRWLKEDRQHKRRTGWWMVDDIDVWKNWEVLGSGMFSAFLAMQHG